MKTKVVALGILAGWSVVASAGLVDGGFDAVGSLGTTPVNTDAGRTGNTQANSLYNQPGTEPGAVTTLDQGWYSGNTVRINQQGTSDKYAGFAANADWDQTRYSIGQMFTDTTVTGNNQIRFDIVDAAYAANSDDRNIVIKIYSVTDPTPWNAKLKLDSDTSSFALLGTQTVDISGGLGTYTSGDINFTATSDLYAIKIELSSSNGNAPGVLGLDNVSVIPEPATMGLVTAFGAGILLIRRLFLI